MPHRHNIPATLEPLDDISVCVSIPNEPTYIAMFLYAVRQLTNDRHYQHDLNLSSMTVRRVWRERMLAPLVLKIANEEYCMDCCTDIITQLTVMQNQITDIQNQVTVLYGNETQGATNITINQTITDVVPITELTEPIAEFVPPDNCTTIADKDAIWAGVSALVDYILQKNEDFLEVVEQNLANIAENADTIISAIPIFETLPFDELVAYAGWSIDQLLEEYRAAITDDLKDQIKCDLFCIATNNGNCGLSFLDVLSYFDSFLPQDWSVFHITITNAVSFAVTGNFIGDGYVYVLSAIQLVIARLGEYFLGDRGWGRYEIKYLTGTNSPDNDWALLCAACPPFWFHYEHDFSDGLGEWIIDGGVQGADGIESEDLGGSAVYAQVHLDLPSPVTVRAAKLYWEQQGGIGNGTYDKRSLSLYEPDETTLVSNLIGGSFVQDGDHESCTNLGSVVRTGRYFIARAQVGRHGSTSDWKVTIKKVELWVTTSDIGEYTTELPC